MENNTSKAPGVVLLVLKGLGALILGYVLVTMLIGLIYTASEGGSDVSKADAINRCEHYYHERDFVGLYDYLELYHLMDEQYDLYWEAAEGYNTLVSYCQWEKAAENGAEEAAQEAQSRYEALEEKANHPDFPQNGKILKGFLEEAKSMCS